MPTLLMRLKGPMQSWGTRSRFDTRDTEKEPSKSGVLGLVCAAMGIDRSDWHSLEPLTKLRFGVRVDQPGILKKDFHTAQNIIRADTKGKQDVAVTNRFFLTDASFLVGLEDQSGSDILKQIQDALKNPVWPLYLGRKSFVPSESVHLADGIVEKSLEEALTTYPVYLNSRNSVFSSYTEDGDLNHANENAEKKKNEEVSLLLMIETEKPEGSVYMDQPIAAFSERKFGSRFVISKKIQLEVANVSESF